MNKILAIFVCLLLGACQTAPRSTDIVIPVEKAKIVQKGIVKTSKSLTASLSILDTAKKSALATRDYVFDGNLPAAKTASDETIKKIAQLEEQLKATEKELWDAMKNADELTSDLLSVDAKFKNYSRMADKAIDENPKLHAILDGYDSYFGFAGLWHYLKRVAAHIAGMLAIIVVGWTALSYFIPAIPLFTKFFIRKPS